MKTETTVTNKIRQAAQTAVELCNTYIKVDAEVRTEIGALEALPKTPTGRLKKDVASAVEKSNAKRREAKLAARNAAEIVKALLCDAAAEHNKRVSSRESLITHFAMHGFAHFEGDLQGAMRVYEASKSYNEGKPHKQTVNPIRINLDRETLFFVNENCGALVVVQISNNEYQITFAGSSEYKDSPIGRYICEFSNRYLNDPKSIVHKQGVDLSSFDNETNVQARSRMLRVVKLIDTLDSLAVSVPVVNDAFEFDFLDYATFCLVEDDRKAYDVLVSLANGGGVYSSIDKQGIVRVKFDVEHRRESTAGYQSLDIIVERS